ncbi:MAG: UDP-glucose 4-epimerase family protein [Alphaproteobacteria bacterium]
MRVLVTGANGLIGRALCPALMVNGHEVVAAVRSPHLIEPSVPVRQITDIGPETSWQAALEGMEAVVHLAGRVHILQDEVPDPLAAYRRVNVEGSRRLAEEAIQAGVKRFVFLSSIKANGEGPKPYREKDVPEPKDPYGISKLEAEIVLRETVRKSPMELVILRPPLVYGPGVKGNLHSLMRLCELGLPLPFGLIHNRRSLIGVDNLASAICCCLTHPKAAGEVFLVSDGEEVSTPELATGIAKKMGKRIRLLPVSPALLEFALRLIGKKNLTRRLFGSLTLDSTHIHDVLGWWPPDSLDTGLRKMVDWHLRHGKIE